MDTLVGIRREDKNRWERRVPLIPSHVKELRENYSIKFLLQPSKIRCFPDNDYTKIGAKIDEDLSKCDIILAVKEIPIKFFVSKKTYIFFSHTIKGQSYNMPMLKRLMELKCQLIDYEKIVDSTDRRLIFFGRYAGLAGMIDTLWAFGRRLKWENIPNPFSNICQTWKYKNLRDAKEHILKVGEIINTDGLPDLLIPLICGFAGYGNVSRGAQEIFNLLPVEEISPSEISSILEEKSKNLVYKVVFKEEDMVELKAESRKLKAEKSEIRFDLQDYYTYPEKYKSKFYKYVPYLSILINAIYWEKRYPRLVTKEWVRKLYKNNLRLRVIGDISCDIEGAIECTVHPTEPDNPVFVYNPIANSAVQGYKSKGIVIMAVDNLPCELAMEASTDFSDRLRPLIPEIVRADFSLPFDECSLPEMIKNAVILWHGELTPKYQYLEEFIKNKG